MTKRPIPLCPQGEHDLVCGCGDSADHPFDAMHYGQVDSCVNCYASREELTQQERTKE